MERHPNAVGVFIINPTYYGVVSDLKRITKMAHEKYDGADRWGPVSHKDFKAAAAVGHGLRCRHRCS